MQDSDERSLTCTQSVYTRAINQQEPAMKYLIPAIAIAAAASLVYPFIQMLLSLPGAVTNVLGV